MTPIILPCTKCLSSISIMLTNHGINPYILDEFAYDSLLMSMNHYHLIKETISTKEKLKYETTHVQVELFLRVIRNTNLRH